MNKKNLEDIMDYLGFTIITDGKEGNLGGTSKDS